MSSRVKIAIIEDDIAISQMYRFKFENDYEVETAVNGRLGFMLAEEMRPDIILTDLMMPEVDGVEMLQKIRATDWGKDTVVIVLTNLGAEEAPEIVKELGVRHFIVKAEMTPRQVAELVNKVLVEMGKIKPTPGLPTTS